MKRLLGKLKGGQGGIQKLGSWSKGEGGESLRYKLKQIEGGWGSSLSVCSLWEKFFLVFQIANKVFSDKLLGSC